MADTQGARMMMNDAQSSATLIDRGRHEPDPELALW